uniref:ABC transporter domain-containing protein n=1 Tax=Timema monikensis TaxID=170555 RepID=A0A7R9HQX4_9NEOP|nr:unnamed protein product [Timema monikensis]
MNVKSNFTPYVQLEKCGGNCAVFNRTDWQELGSYKSVISKFFSNTQPPQKISLTNHEISLRRMCGSRMVVIREKQDAGLKLVAYLAHSWVRLCEVWDLIDVAVDRRDLWSTPVARYCKNLIDTLVVDVCDTITELVDVVDLEQPTVETHIKNLDLISVTYYTRQVIGLDYYMLDWNTTGEVLINGRSIDPAFMANMSGFVPQQDLVVDSLSVREHMEFMAQLKMDRRMMPNQRKRRINSLMSELSLTKCCHTRLSALSGGEKKRLALAVQLLTDPPLLFCDEPTTGLDSYSAGVVIEKLRQFAASGKVVVCTIHQPASGLFDMFNQVLLVARGRVAFYGDVCDAAKYFNSLVARQVETGIHCDLETVSYYMRSLTLFILMTGASLVARQVETRIIMGDDSHLMLDRRFDKSRLVSGDRFEALRVGIGNQPVLSCSRSMAYMVSVSMPHTSMTSVSTKSLQYWGTGVNHIYRQSTVTSMSPTPHKDAPS